MALQVDDIEFGVDRALIERSRLGDAGAFEEIYHRHRERLFRYCLYRLKDRYEAEDVVQEAFARAWKNIAQFGDDPHLYGWLRTVAGNICTDSGRRQARSRPCEVVDLGVVEGDQERLVDAVDFDLLRQAMDRLPERHRQVLELRERQGLSYEQLAAETGTTVGTVESLLWRARQSLRKQFLALARDQGILAAIPGLGLVARRLIGAHGRLVARIGGVTPMTLMNLGNAAVSMIVGSVMAAALSIAGVGHAAGDGAVPTRQVNLTTVSLRLPEAPWSASSSGLGQTSAGTPAASTAAQSGSAGPERLNNPLQPTSGAAARSEAGSDAVHASAGSVAVGVDPRTTYEYVSRVVANHAPVVP
ncbi:MAG: RNA polymerase sigma factor [Acidimicrobiales bacterium]